VHRVELACGRVGDDGDVMAAQLVRPALRLLAGWASCMAASCCTCMTRRFVPLHASVVMLMPSVLAHTPVGNGLVVRGGDFSCEAETRHGGSSSGKLVGDAANWPKTGCLARVGLDQGLLSSLS
jgi:hypothetical protein